MTHSLVQAYQSIPPDTIALVAGVLGLSAFQQKIKNWLELENPKVLVLLTTTFSLAAAIIPAALGYLGSNPGAIGAHTAAVFTGMTLAYRYIIQPSSARLGSFKDDVAKAKAYKAASAAAADGVQVPAGGVPPSALPRLADSTPTQNTNEFTG